MIKGLWSMRSRSCLNFWIRALLILSFLTGSLYPKESSAGCGACVLTALIPATQATIMAALAAYALTMNEAITSAFAGATGSMSTIGTSAIDAANGAGKVMAGTGSAAAYAGLAARQVFDVDNENCRLQASNNAVKRLEDNQRLLTGDLEDGLINLFLNPRIGSRERLLAITMQGNCRNGMLVPDAIGQQTFTRLGCFSDPDFVFASSKPSTLYDLPERVLIQPTQAQLNILLNPNSGGNYQATWNALSVQQKKWMAAYRYCEQTIVGAGGLTPMGNLRDNTAQTPENMMVAVNNLSAFAKLNAMAYICAQEIARRTGADPASLGTGMADNNARIGNQLVGFGLNPASWRVGSTDYISPLLNAYAGSVVYCAPRSPSDPLKNTTGQADRGTNAQRTQNTLLCSVGLTQTFHATEQVYTMMRNDMIAGVGQVSRQFRNPAPIATIRSEVEPLVKPVGYRAKKAEAKP
jgi:hypothetical protein